MVLKISTNSFFLPFMFCKKNISILLISSKMKYLWKFVISGKNIVQFSLIFIKILTVIFNDSELCIAVQIHELHRIYQKQRELMDEIKRIELHRYSLRLETSSSSSSLYYSQNLPWLTSQSSVLNAEGRRLPLASMQEKSRQLFSTPDPAATAIKESLEDPKLSGLTYRKVGKKILDLQLPAAEYIDSEGESCENGRVIKEPPLSTYTLNGISKGVYNDEKPYGTNSNGFTDLNLPFKLEEETDVKSDDFLASIHHRNYTFHDMPGRMTLGSHKQKLEVCSDPPLPNHGGKHGRLSSNIGAGEYLYPKLHCSYYNTCLILVYLSLFSEFFVFQGKMVVTWVLLLYLMIQKVNMFQLTLLVRS